MSLPNLKTKIHSENASSKKKNETDSTNSSQENSDKKNSKTGGGHNGGSTKHVPCKFFKHGNCTAGDDCTFSHDPGSFSKAKICEYFLKGNCKYGTKCVLLHTNPSSHFPTLPPSARSFRSFQNPKFQFPGLSLGSGQSTSLSHDIHPGIQYRGQYLPGLGTSASTTAGPTTTNFGPSINSPTFNEEGGYSNLAFLRLQRRNTLSSFNHENPELSTEYPFTDLPSINTSAMDSIINRNSTLDYSNSGQSGLNYIKHPVEIPPPGIEKNPSSFRKMNLPNSNPYTEDIKSRHSLNNHLGNNGFPAQQELHDQSQRSLFTQANTLIPLLDQVSESYKRLPGPIAPLSLDAKFSYGPNSGNVFGYSFNSKLEENVSNHFSLSPSKSTGNSNSPKNLSNGYLKGMENPNIGKRIEDQQVQYPVSDFGIQVTSRNSLPEPNSIKSRPLTSAFVSVEKTRSINDNNDLVMRHNPNQNALTGGSPRENIGVTKLPQ
ncbi:hypothetical protein BB559_004032, partial [Furculomyces boomerangus]